MIHLRKFFHPYFWLVLFAGIILGLLFAAQPVSAQDSTPVVSTVTDDQVNAIAKQLYCPVCENTPLDVCPTKACAQWREEIRVMLGEGKSEQEIKDYFVRLHGIRVLAAPPARGWNWLVYLVPPFAILGGGLILYRAFREWRKPAPQPPPPPARAEPEDDYILRLEEELRKR
jgi:cytochrome c-type biogenesis protein CcmH